MSLNYMKLKMAVIPFTFNEVLIRSIPPASPSVHIYFGLLLMCLIEINKAMCFMLKQITQYLGHIAINNFSGILFQPNIMLWVIHKIMRY